MSLKHEPSFEFVDDFAVETLCLLVNEKERPLTGLSAYVDWRLCGRLSELIIGGKFKGKVGECVLMPTFGRIKASTLLICGAGKNDEEAIEHVVKAAQGTKTKSVAVALPKEMKALEPKLKKELGDAFRAWVSE